MRPDATDGLYVLGLVISAGSLWWLTGHPASAVLAVGVALLLAALVSMLR